MGPIHEYRCRRPARCGETGPKKAGADLKEQSALRVDAEAKIDPHPSMPPAT